VIKEYHPKTTLLLFADCVLITVLPAGTKAAAALPTFLTDPVLSKDKDLIKTAWSKAFGVDIPWFQYLEDHPQWRDTLIRE
jgi:hypothetical protein